MNFLLKKLQFVSNCTLCNDHFAEQIWRQESGLHIERFHLLLCVNRGCRSGFYCVETGAVNAFVEWLFEEQKTLTAFLALNLHSCWNTKQVVVLLLVVIRDLPLLVRADAVFLAHWTKVVVFLQQLLPAVVVQTVAAVHLRNDVHRVLHGSHANRAAVRQVSRPTLMRGKVFAENAPTTLVTVDPLLLISLTAHVALGTVKVRFGVLADEAHELANWAELTAEFGAAVGAELAKGRFTVAIAAK